MKSVRVVGPSDYPVTLQQLKEHVAIAHTDDDALLERLLQGAVSSVERKLWSKLVTQTWDFYFDRFESPFRLPFPPCQSIVSLKYTDSNGTLQTLATTVYELGDDNGVGIVRLAYNQTWPTCRGHYDDVVIRATVGYGPPEDVPAELKLAICQTAANAYEFRETYLEANKIVEIPQGIDSYLSLWSFAEVG